MHEPLRPAASGAAPAAPGAAPQPYASALRPYAPQPSAPRQSSPQQGPQQDSPQQDSPQGQPQQDPRQPSAPQPGRAAGRRRKSSNVRLKALAVIGAGVVVLIAGFQAVHPLSPKPKPAPVDQTAGHIATGPLNGRTTASFTVSSGAEEVTVHSADLTGELYRVSTPPGSSVTPVVEDRADGITLTLRGTQVAGQASIHVYLNKTVLWQVHLAGGGLSQVVDFPSGKLASVYIDAGAKQVEVSVPPPTGTMRIALTGGSGLFAVHLAAGPPVQVSDPAGAGALTIDGKPGTGPLVTTDGWATAQDRYQVQSGGAVAKLTVDRHP